MELYLGVGTTYCVHFTTTKKKTIPVFKLTFIWIRRFEKFKYHAYSSEEENPNELPVGDKIKRHRIRFRIWDKFSHLRTIELVYLTFKGTCQKPIDFK